MKLYIQHAEYRSGKRCSISLLRFKQIDCNLSNKNVNRPFYCYLLFN